MGILRDAADLITEVRRISEMENTNFVTDNEIVDYLNSAWRWANMKLGESYEDWNIETHDFPSVAGTREYAVPADFVRLRKLMYVRDYGTSSEREYPMHRVNWQATDSYPLYASRPNRFMLRGGNIRLFPVVSSVHNFRLYYLPAPATFTSASVDLEMHYGIDRFIVYDAAMRCLQKEKSDSTEVTMERNNSFNDLMQSADNRDSSEPMAVQNTEYSTSADWWDAIW